MLRGKLQKRELVKRRTVVGFVKFPQLDCFLKRFKVLLMNGKPMAPHKKQCDFFT